MMAMPSHPQERVLTAYVVISLIMTRVSPQIKSPAKWLRQQSEEHPNGITITTQDGPLRQERQYIVLFVIYWRQIKAEACYTGHTSCNPLNPDFSPTDRER